MGADWNWFFSSVAQSVASLAGIIGAFAISRLLNTQAEFDRKRLRTAELLSESHRLRDAAASRYFDWFNRREHSSALRRLERQLKEDESFRTSEEYYLSTGFSPYTARDEVLEEIREKISEIERQRQPPPAKIRQGGAGPFASGPLSGITGIRMPDLAAFTPPSQAQLLAESDTRREFEEEREHISRFVVEVRHHIRRVRHHSGSLAGNPERSSVLERTFIAILLLFWVGIIYPLSFMPLRAGVVPALSLGSFFTILLSLRGAILAVVAVVFTTLILGLVYLNRRLHYPAAEVTELEATSEFGYYSPYLAIMADNERASALSPTVAV